MEYLKNKIGDLSTVHGDYKLLRQCVSYLGLGGRALYSQGHEFPVTRDFQAGPGQPPHSRGVEEMSHAVEEGSR